jgi:hypothetical protein
MKRIRLSRHQGKGREIPAHIEEKDPIPVACSPLNGSIFFFFITLKPLHISVKNWELALSSGERPLNRGGRTYARENTLHPTLYTVYRKQLGLNRKP